MVIITPNIIGCFSCVNFSNTKSLNLSIFNIIASVKKNNKSALLKAKGSPNIKTTNIRFSGSFIPKIKTNE